MQTRNTYLTMLCLLAMFQVTFLSARGIEDYVNDIPGIGLIANEINFEGIKLKNLSFDTNGNSDDDVTVSKKYVITYPGKKHTVTVDYKINNKVLETFDLHHFLFGLHKDGPQGCLLHSLGITERKGRVTFTVTAPDKPGVYQLRFCHCEGYGSFEDVKDRWFDPSNATSATIMGIVVVK